MSDNDIRLMESRQLCVQGLQLRETENKGDGTQLEGVAVPFNKRYKLFADYAEVFDPDCDFGTRNVKISDSHGQLIGRVTSMESQEDGLHITAKLSDTTDAREAVSLIRDGVYDAFSVGFTPVENATVFSDDGVFEVHRKAVDLYEVAVTGIPAYQDAHITSQRSEKPTTKVKESIMTDENELAVRLDSIQEEQRSMKAAIAKGITPTTSKPLGSEYRSSGEYLQALYKGDETAVSLMHECRDLIAIGDTGNKSTWIADDLRLIQQRRKVTNLLTHDTLPATGMTMEYNVVTEDTSTVDKQASEGAALQFGKVKFGTKSADIDTYGGYTTLSRQVIERSTTPMLNTALAALRNAYAKTTELAVRKFLYDLIAAQRDATSKANKIDAPATLANMKIDDWAALIIDAAELADDRNVNLTRLAVSKDVMLSLVKLKDTGTRFFDLSGDGSDTIGDFDLTGIAGRFLRVPVQLLPKAPAGTASFIDPESVTVWESGGPTQLTDGDPTKLTENYSVYGYMAIADTHVDGLIPVKFATAG